MPQVLLSYPLIPAAAAAAAAATAATAAAALAAASLVVSVNVLRTIGPPAAAR